MTLTEAQDRELMAALEPKPRITFEQFKALRTITGANEVEAVLAVLGLRKPYDVGSDWLREHGIAS
jgi:hypothetical protein